MEDHNTGAGREHDGLQRFALKNKLLLAMSCLNVVTTSQIVSFAEDQIFKHKKSLWGDISQSNHNWFLISIMVRVLGLASKTKTRSLSPFPASSFASLYILLCSLPKTLGPGSALGLSIVHS